MKRRNELNMKPAAVIHMLSPRNFKIGSYTRSPHVGGLATVSRHPAVVHAGGGGVSIYIYEGPTLGDVLFLFGLSRGSRVFRVSVSRG